MIYAHPGTNSGVTRLKSWHPPPPGVSGGYGSGLGAGSEFSCARGSTRWGPSAGNTASRLFLLMQSAGGPAIAAARASLRGARHVCPPPLQPLPQTRAARNAWDAAPLPPLSSSCSHGRPNNEGNCLWFWLYFYKNACVDWACDSSNAQLAERGRRKDHTVSCHANVCNFSLISHRRTGPYILLLFRLLLNPRSQDVPPASSSFTTAFVNRDKRLLAAPSPACFEARKGRGSSSQFSKMHRRWGISEERSGGCHWL